MPATAPDPPSPPRADSKADALRARMARLARLGAAVRAARDGRGLSRQALARQAGISARYLAQLEAGQGNISVEKLEAVAQALGLRGVDLLGGDGRGNGPAAGLSGDTEAALRARLAEAAGTASAARLREALALLRGPEAAPPVIALVGLRGAGKSTLGPLLARRLGLAFLELDAQIEEAEGLAIAELYELHGEGYYRQAERRALQALTDAGTPVVVAVSGGIVNDAETFALLRRQTRLVWVHAEPEQHMARVEAQGDTRPMRNRPNAMAELNALLRARLPLYRQAPHHVDTARADPESCAATLAVELGI